jgi:RNA polymerase sigma factor (sigma-70 family)
MTALPSSSLRSADRVAHVAGSATEPGDHELIERTLAGDQAAFAAIMRRHNAQLYRLARATLRDDTEAEDALQDAYFAAYRALATFRRDAALSTWLSRLVLNECFARLRRTARRQAVVPISVAHQPGELERVPDLAEGPDAATARAETRLLLERTIDELPADFRLAFVMREVDDLSVADVATCLGIPEATVRTRVYRARALLREKLSRRLRVAERGIYEFGGDRCNRVVARVLARIAALDDPTR